MERPLRVLVVDDDEVDRLAVRRALGRSGLAVDVCEAEDGPAAVAALTSERFDCALLDFNLPPLDALVVLRELAAAGVDTPVVILTGQGDERLAAEVIRLGAADYLTKAELAPETVARSLGHVTRVRAAERQLKRLASYPEQCPMPIVEVAGDGTVTYCNPAAEAAFPSLPGDRSAHPLLAGWAATRAALDRGDAGVVTRELEVGGATYHLSVSRAADDCYRVWAADITERRLAEQRLHHSAFYDVLTDLPNRALFVDRLERAIERAKRRPDSQFAVLFLDLDRFKVVNDSLGHQRGDQLLVVAAERLQRCVRAEDTVARFGGDEFAILIANPEDITEVTRIAERILAEFARPFELGDRPVYSSTSIGIALSVGGASHTADSFLRDADTAMYRAKGQGGGRCQVFDRGMHEQAIEMLHLETDLRVARERGELTVVYQPVVAVASATVVGVEALLRWRHPSRDLLGPEDFLSLAEESGVIVELDHWMLAAACRQLAQWRAELGDLAPAFVSVNLSGRHLVDGRLVGEVRRAVAAAGLDPDRPGLELELTEAALSANVEQTLGPLTALHGLGVGVTMDDFATGASSLASLRRLPLDTVKVDLGSVADACAEGADLDMVRAVFGLAGRLGSRVVAERVESLALWNLVRQLGCELAQGYWLAPPLEAAAVADLVRGGAVVAGA